MRFWMMFLGLLWAAGTSHVIDKCATKSTGRPVTDYRKLLAVNCESKCPYFLLLCHPALAPAARLTLQNSEAAEVIAILTNSWKVFESASTC